MIFKIVKLMCMFNYRPLPSGDAWEVFFLKNMDLNYKVIYGKTMPCGTLFRKESIVCFFE